MPRTHIIITLWFWKLQSKGLKHYASSPKFYSPSPRSRAASADAKLPISRMQIWSAVAALLAALVLRADLLWNGGRTSLGHYGFRGSQL